MKYKYHQQIKVAIWQDQEFVVEASTKQEADEIAKRYAEEDVSNGDVELLSTEFLFDTQEFVKPDWNYPTIEIFDNGNLIADNRLK